MANTERASYVGDGEQSLQRFLGVVAHVNVSGVVHPISSRFVDRFGFEGGGVCSFFSEVNPYVCCTCKRKNVGIITRRGSTVGMVLVFLLSVCAHACNTVLLTM